RGTSGTSLSSASCSPCDFVELPASTVRRDQHGLRNRVATLRRQIAAERWREPKSVLSAERAACAMLVGGPVVEAWARVERCGARRFRTRYFSRAPQPPGPRLFCTRRSRHGVLGIRLRSRVVHVGAHLRRG